MGAVHMKDEELELFAKSGAGIAHCPRSNFTIFSGVAHVRRMMKFGVKVGLGTDISGGCSASMWDSMRATIDSSACIHFRDSETPPLNYKQAFYLATVGGSQLVGMEDQLGSFSSGKWFNA